MSWIVYGKTWGEFQDAKLNLAGTRVQVKDGAGELDTYLIGDLNTEGGACNCCEPIRYKDVITQYQPEAVPE